MKPSDLDMPPPAALEGTRRRAAGSAARSAFETHGCAISMGRREYTGSVGPKPEAPAPAAPREDGSAGGERHGASRAKGILSAGERAVLESLQQRRQELETRAREIEVRDSLLKAAEKRIEQRLQELKELETRVNGTISKKDEEEAAQVQEPCQACTRT